jgi:multidrug resistance efflux pump
MRSTLKQTGVLVGAAVMLAAAVAAGQDPKPGAADRRGIVNVFNSVESRTTILSSQPHGARVQKGDVLCELDPSELKDRLAIQEIAIRSAKADAQAARLVREAAELGRFEYIEGRFRKDLATVESEIKLAESNLTQDEDALEWARRMFDKGYVSMATKIAEELKFKKSQFALEQAQSKLNVLVKHTKARTVKELAAAVETALGCELAKQAAFERERLMGRKLGDQVRRCKVVAPVSGLLHHVAPIGPGAVVHDGQLLFQIDPEGGSVKKAG